ncbi:MAG: type I-U CRISPR-associated helicase/endonuclease Cas3, partial [Firmicutes bacterium]|nr:type I-U CRISPR-associated helicase/endonuclease Cas3 [Bacillota bacterium]
MLPAFDQFFRELTGFPPFPWQQRLATLLADPAASWPTWLALPTGAGKTSLLPIWAYALAVQTAVHHRTVPLRAVYVVDRRLLVDQAEQTARDLAQRLGNAPPDTALRAVADQLRIWSSDPPLLVAALRGGRPRLQHWVDHPLQPAILLSTIDQAGSRLLFRGYGVPRRTWSIEAGLLGIDALWIVDEAHLAHALQQTLATVRQTQPSTPATAVPPLRTVFLSATPPADADPASTFTLTSEDHTHPILGPRLTRPKHLRLQAAGSLTLKTQDAASDHRQAAQALDQL